MANYTLSSNIVKGFPIAKRDDNYADAYLLKEENLTQTIRALFPYNESSFIISTSKSAPLEFVIYGYYFNIVDISTLPDGSDLYAHIYVNNSTGNLTGLQVENDVVLFIDDHADISNNFIALYLSDSASEPTISSGKGNYTHHSLKLLTNGTLCEQSTLTYQIKALKINTAAGTISTEKILTSLDLEQKITDSRKVAHFTITQGKDK